MSAFDKNYETDELSRWVREAMDEPAPSVQAEVENNIQPLDVNR